MFAMNRDEMKTTLQQFHHLAQSIWLDNITRRLRGSQTRRPYIDDLAVTFPAAGISWKEESL
jgi:hypothetical protein